MEIIQQSEVGLKLKKVENPCGRSKFMSEFSLLALIRLLKLACYLTEMITHPFDTNCSFDEGDITYVRGQLDPRLVQLKDL